MSLGVLIRLSQASIFGVGCCFVASAGLKFEEERIEQRHLMQQQRSTLQREQRDLEQILEEHAIEHMSKDERQLSQSAPEKVPQQDGPSALPSDKKNRMPPRTTIQTKQVQDGSGSQEGPVWRVDPKSDSVRYLEAELEKHKKHDLRKTADVRMHQTLVKAAIVQFDRLNKTLAKTQKEHDSYKATALEQIKKAAYPSRDLIDAADLELNELRFSYLPFGTPLVDAGSQEQLSAQDLDNVVSATLAHLKQDLIPKLKQMQTKVQRRNIWLECEERNRHQAAVFQVENDHVRNLIMKDLARTKDGFEATMKYPEVITEAVKMRHVTYDAEIFAKLTELQMAQSRKLQTQLRPIVEENVAAHGRQSFTIGHAQKLRQLQGVLQSELLSSSSERSSRYTPRQVAKDIGLTNDVFVSSMLAQKVYEKPTTSMGELIRSFPDVKRKTLLEAFTTDDSIEMYVYGHLKLLLKESLIGNFQRGLSTEAENCANVETRTALRMDHAEQSLKDGELGESVRLTEALVRQLPQQPQQQQEQQVSQLPDLEKWLGAAKNRLTREENIRLLSVYTDKLIGLNKKHSLSGQHMQQRL